MTATVDQALANLAEAARSGRTYDWNPGDGLSGWCLRAQRFEHGVPGGVNTAWDSALMAMPLSASAPPRGAILYWSKDSGDGGRPGHIATADGNGNCWTTDFYRTGKVDLAAVADINREWSNLTYRGWGTSINGVQVLAHGQDQQQGGDHHEIPDPTDEDDMPDMTVREGDPAMPLTVKGCDRLEIVCAIDTYAEITEVLEDGTRAKPAAWADYYGDDNRLGILEAPNHHTADSPLQAGSRLVTVGRVSGGPLYVRAYKAA